MINNVLERIQQTGLTLNQEKCIISTNTVKLLGHVVDTSSIRSDPDKINNATKEMREPSTPTEVRRFLGMVNQLGKFLPILPEKTEPLRALITSKSEWMWRDSRQRAFETITKKICLNHQF